MKQLSIYIVLVITSCLGARAQSAALHTAPTPNNVVLNVFFTGKVTDAKTGEILAGASILFPDVKVGGTTNQQGVFKLQNIPSGKYLVEVSFAGYASIVESITLNGNTERILRFRALMLKMKL
ncbi:carboxypeptidase-like regulatory domain-containing protein [Paraflavitalea speifideaquila]|uniref:carboxypeptidase-like regulatory domain-containing protein n=1 Tax=Paraflavitalea speifideaquila TaxID=3076558 RepID=UPI0028F105A5|nr:carboxypeptidase-like regulatory domain-containing protein [Paraflavitalea speifideiaquila]